MVMLSPPLLDTRHINRIVLSVCTDKSNIHHSVRVIDLHNKPILIPRHIEDDSIAHQNTRRTKVRFDGRWGYPISMGNLLVPGF